MLLICVLLIATALAIDPLTGIMPLLTPFNLAAASFPYMINGTYCGNSGAPCVPSYLVVDPINKRMTFGLGFAGVIVVLETTSYTYSQPLTPGCTEIPGFTWDDQVAGYTRALSMPGSTDGPIIANAYWQGDVHDVNSCNHPVGVVIRTRHNYIVEYNFWQNVPVPITPGGPKIYCFYAVGSIVYDVSTLSINQNFDSFFALPSSCDTPIDYCSDAFPVGNPCTVPQLNRGNETHSGETHSGETDSDKLYKATIMKKYNQYYGINKYKLI